VIYLIMMDTLLDFWESLYSQSGHVHFVHTVESSAQNITASRGVWRALEPWDQPLRMGTIHTKTMRMIIAFEGRFRKRVRRESTLPAFRLSFARNILSSKVLPPFHCHLPLFTIFMPSNLSAPNAVNSYYLGSPPPFLYSHY
jgi:hypothetical protein